MAAKFWHSLIFGILAMPGFSWAIDASSLRCSDLLAGRASFVRHPIVALRENLPALVSRLRPVYSDPRFDVRILSTGVSRNTFSPAQLKTAAIQEIQDLQSAYIEMGFSFRSYLQVLVEAHPNAMGTLGLSEEGRIIWTDTAVATPWVGNAREFIGIPNIFGRRSLFLGQIDKHGFPDMPRFLALPAVSSTYHSIQNKFVTSHELAHETENTESHKDLMWREARADFLAYVTTGQTDVVFPEGIELELVRPDGTTYKQKVTIARSLSHPTIASLDSIFPHLAAYHHNSQIISSALFNIAQRLGNNRAVELVKWMDRQQGEDIIPYLEPKPPGTETEFEPKAYTEYIDHNDLAAVRAAIKDHLNKIGQFFRRWLNESTLTQDEKNTILLILQDKKI